MKLIHMPDFDDVIYDFRTMAERVNARLKDEFGGAVDQVSDHRLKAAARQRLDVFVVKGPQLVAFEVRAGKRQFVRITSVAAPSG